MMIPSRAALSLAAVFLAAATPAAAAFVGPCGLATCTLDPADSPYGDGSFDFDYTVPADGRTYRWTITTDPLATITLAEPNQTEIITTIRTGTGFDTGYDGNPAYVFAPTITPGRSSWIVRAPRAFDVCASPGPEGEVCAAVVNIWGNGTLLTVGGSAPVVARFSESLVPEPGVWGMLVVGFGLVGGVLRGRGGYALGLR